MSTTGICNYCKNTKKLIDAHIIPKGFLGNLTKQKFLEISTEYQYTKKRPKGPYDQYILCAECDHKIGIYDGYAKKLLIDEIDSYRNIHNPSYLIPHQTLNYENLKKFFISLIWRASISDAEIFSRVSLGKYNEIALSHISSTTPLDDNLFAVLLFKDSKSIKYQNVITFTTSKLAGKKAYKIHFSGYQATIVPNAKDMRWIITNETMSPSELFLRNGFDFNIIEIDQDVSGKDDMLNKVYKR